MNIKCVRSISYPSDSQLVPIVDLGKSKMYINASQAKAYALDDNRSVFLFGDIFYFLNDGKASFIDLSQTAAVKKIFLQNPLEKVITHLEGEYIGVYVDRKKKEVRIFADRYTRLDGFYAKQGVEMVLANELETVFQYVKPEYDQKMLGHMFSVFGWYAPKGSTIYSNVQRLGVGEILTVKDVAIESKQIPFVPQEIVSDDKADLNQYEKALRSSIAARVPKGNEKIWVSSSSGWDSSVILGLLVDMYGASRINMMTGSMQYSKATGLINRYELDKIKKIGAFYGIRPHLVPLDFKNMSAVSYWSKLCAKLKSKHMYSLSGFNFSRISDGIAKADSPGRIVFNGETSDSFHNFGFSQFCTFFHTEKQFTEYGDKMNCYLYGPTFLNKVLQGTHEKDKVFQIFQRMMPSVSFEKASNNRTASLENYILPLFYGGPRLPFAKTIDNPALAPTTLKSIRHFMFKDLMPEALKSMNPKNMYAWMIYMYHNMHSQGSTVAIHRQTMALNGHHCRSPFNDYQMIDILSKAPESWGRGLNFNHTKYPLKWVAEHKMKFPYALLQEGPHSYLYDVIEGFSLMREIAYNSAFTGHFKDVLQERRYRDLFDPAYFNVKYLDRLADDFIHGKKVSGQDFTNTLSLITLCSTGWY